MSGIIIHNLPRFEITSWGNGLSYCLKRKADNTKIFVQGDDASEFYSRFEGFSNNPGWTFDDAAYEMFMIYNGEG